MRSLPDSSNRPSRRARGSLRLAAAVGFVAFGLAALAVRSQLDGLIVSAELTAGAALQAGSGQALPVVLALVIPVGAVALWALVRGPRADGARERSRSRVGNGQRDFELRSPERVLAETDSDFLRFTQ